jgi:D-lactate dehydrogenase (cytochrome)
MPATMNATLVSAATADPPPTASPPCGEPSDHLVAELRRIVGPGGVIDDAASLALYSVDFGEVPRARAALIVRPSRTDQVAPVMALAYAAGVPVVVRGGGMSYTQGYLPQRPGSLMLDMSALDRVVEVNLQDMYITVEAGCTWKQLYTLLAGTGCHLAFGGTMSGERATVGGGLGNGATGVKRGELPDIVIGLEVVLADGRTIQTGARATGRPGAPVGPLKHYGPDLTGLFIHDAGALGVKTQVSLRIEREPAGKEFAVMGFQDSADLVAAMVALQRQGLLVEHGAFSEYHNQMFANEPAPPRGEMIAAAKAVMQMASSRWQGLRLLAQMARPGGLKFMGRWKHTLFLGTDGATPAIARAHMRMVRRVARAHGGTPLPRTLAIALRAAPFYPVERLIVGFGRENNTFPSNRLVALSNAQRAYDTATRYFAEHASVMQAHGLKHTIIFKHVHNNVFGIEPIIYWRDAMSPLRAHILGPARRAELMAIAPDEAARAAAIALRSGLCERMNAIPGAHYQIGKYYPYHRDLADEATASALLDIKRVLDPKGLLNPGGLGLDRIAARAAAADNGKEKT